MSDNNSANRFDAIDSFFDAYTLEETREFLWDWMVKTFERSGKGEWNGIEVANLLDFYKRIEKLIKLVHKNRQN